MGRTEAIRWTLLAKGEDFWGVQVNAVEPESGMLCECEQTQGVFRVVLAGVFDSKAHAAGRRILRFHPVRGSADLQKGFQMIAPRADSAGGSPLG